MESNNMSEQPNKKQGQLDMEKDKLKATKGLRGWTVSVCCSHNVDSEGKDLGCRDEK